MSEWKKHQKSKYDWYHWVWRGRYIVMLTAHCSAKLPKWCGERPGKKATDPASPEEEEEDIKTAEVIEEIGNIEEEEDEEDEEDDEDVEDEYEYE